MRQRDGVISKAFISVIPPYIIPHAYIIPCCLPLLPTKSDAAISPLTKQKCGRQQLRLLQKLRNTITKVHNES